jgi:hypothetical protein
MKIAKQLLDFYINASIHVALAVFAMMMVTEFALDLPNNQNLNLFVFFGTITGYNFVKFAGVAKLHHRSLTESLKVIQIFSFFCFLAMCYFASLLPLSLLLLSLPFSLLTVLYAVPFLSGFQKSLRNVSYLKIIIVALVWGGFTVLIPVYSLRESFDFITVAYTIQRFLLVVVLILPFDIRDVQYDEISLQTIPKKIGLEKTKRLGIILLIISLVIEYLLFDNENYNFSFLIFFFLTIILLMRAKVNQPKYYSSFLVESLPVFWWLILLILH